jgi:hypothetical protein
MWDVCDWEGWLFFGGGEGGGGGGWGVGGGGWLVCCGVGVVFGGDVLWVYFSMFCERADGVGFLGLFVCFCGVVWRCVGVGWVLVRMGGGGCGW